MEPRRAQERPEILPARREGLRRDLLTWFRANKRSLPWRDKPTPYQVWVSEVMLQQTRVEVVRDYYRRWMEKFPDLESLAASEEDDVLSLWQGLGYYSRAKRLRAGALYVSKALEGVLPASPEELEKIPGIGPYSAGAISSIAYGRPSPIVDGNVIRVLSRWFCLAGDPGRAPLKAMLWELAAELVPRRAPSDFNQGLMELGALICTPKSPACHSCPVRNQCQAYASGEVSRFPELPKRAPPTALEMAVGIVLHRGRVLVQKLPDDARWWAGMYALPFVELKASQKPGVAARRLFDSLGLSPGPGKVKLLSPLKHTVTRYKIELTPAVLRPKSGRHVGGGLIWVARGKLPDLAMPAPHRKALELAEFEE